MQAVWSARWSLFFWRSAPVRSLELKRWSGAGPRRRPLLQERAHALLGVGGHGVQRHDGLREVVGLALIDVDLPVERFLADLYGQRAGVGDLAGELSNRSVELIDRHDPVDEAPLGRRDGVDEL